MIFDRVLAHAPDAGLLPAQKLHRPTVAVMAIMTFAMLVVAAAGLALAAAAGKIASGVENRFVIELPSGSATGLPRAVAAARSVAGVERVTPVPEKEMRRTLERWLGSAASSSDLPVPALVTVEIAPGISATALAAILRSRIPDSSIVAESSELKPLLDSINALKWLALSLIVAMAVAASAAVVLAARGILDTHRPTVEIMHGIGATDSQLTRLFERKIAVDSIAGAVAGTIAASAVLLAVGSGIGVAAGGLASSVAVGWSDLLILALIPVAAVVLAVAFAHRTLLKALRLTL